MASHERSVAPAEAVERRLTRRPTDDPAAVQALRSRDLLALQRSAGNTMIARAPAELETIVRTPRGPAALPPGIEEPTPEELEEVAGALGLKPDDPEVRTAVIKAKIDELIRHAAAPPPAAVPGAGEPQAVQEAPKEDPNDPGTWKQQPGESMEAFLERQRKGLLAAELKRTGKTEDQLREQVQHTGTQEETHGTFGSGTTWSLVREAIPTPGGGVRMVVTVETRTGDHIKRSQRATDLRTGAGAVRVTEITGDRERVVSETGDVALLAPRPKKGKAHRKWTPLGDGRVKVEAIDEWGVVVPNSTFITGALQSPQDRIRAEQARDPNAVWRP